MFYVAVGNPEPCITSAIPNTKKASSSTAGGSAVSPANRNLEPWQLSIPAREKKWEHKLFSPPWAGVLSTAGNLVFGSTNEGQVFALHAATGKPLWRYQAGGVAHSNPISYSVDGKQYIAVTMGNSLYIFGLS